MSIKQELKGLRAKSGFEGCMEHDMPDRLHWNPHRRDKLDYDGDYRDGSDDETSSDDDDIVEEKLEVDHLALFHVGDFIEFIEANFVCRTCFVCDNVGLGVQASTSCVGLAKPP